VCADGYYSPTPGTNCQDINECQLLTSGCSQQCTNTPGSFRCSCATNYVLDPLDGKTCRLAPGIANQCQNGIICSAGYCSSSGSCVCGQGYVLNSALTNCIDIDECNLGTSRCAGGGSCVNTPGSYACLCPLGTQLGVDQRTCEACPTGRWGPSCRYYCRCAVGASCNVLTGCSSCQDTGWTGGNCDVDVDECRNTPGVCGPNAVCRNLNGSFSCQCNQWYQRKGNVCQLLDACQYNGTQDMRYPPGTSPCLNNGFCQSDSSAPGRYVCQCAAGYTGTHCETDVDECASSPCRNGATCIGFVGRYFCQCAPLYSGPRCENYFTPLTTVVPVPILDVSSAGTSPGLATIVIAAVLGTVGLVLIVLLSVVLFRRFNSRKRPMDLGPQLQADNWRQMSATPSASLSPPQVPQPSTFQLPNYVGRFHWSPAFNPTAIQPTATRYIGHAPIRSDVVDPLRQKWLGTSSPQQVVPFSRMPRGSGGAWYKPGRTNEVVSPAVAPMFRQQPVQPSYAMGSNWFSSTKNDGGGGGVRDSMETQQPRYYPEMYTGNPALGQFPPRRMISRPWRFVDSAVL
jgi:hypothetical protein